MTSTRTPPRRWASGPPPAVPPIQIRLRRAVAVLALGVLCMIGFVLSCTAVRTDPSPHIAVLDRLRVPRSWVFGGADTVRNALMGSRVDRYYLVDTPPRQLVDPASRMLEAAGFSVEINRAPADWCDDRLAKVTPRLECPERIIPPCGPPNDIIFPPQCYLDGDRNGDRIRVFITGPFEPGVFYVDQERRVATMPFQGIVRVSVDY